MTSKGRKVTHEAKVHEANVDRLVEVSESLVHPGEEGVDGDEEALDDRGHEDEGHGHAEDGVEDAEDLALGGEGTLVAITCRNV